MNILVINGSPKGNRSNTYRLTQAFLEGVTQAVSADVETLEVRSMNVKPCLGCFACWSKTPGKCCMDDDMRPVLEKMLWADMAVWSFPLYYFSVPGPLKNLIDRQLPLSLPFMAAESENGGHPSRYDMSGKKTVLISTCGFYTAGENYNSVRAMFDHFCGEGNYETIFCGQGELFRVPELAARTDEYLEFVRRAGAEYAAGGILPDTRQKLEQPLYPRAAFEAMADASWGITESGEKADDSLVFTRQMAALYNKAAYPGHDILLDMHYTDLEKTYRVVLTKEGSKVLTDPQGECTTCIHTPYTVWRSIAAGEIEGAEAMMKHLYRVEGDFDLMLHWDDYFGSSAAQAPQQQKKEAGTDMRILLLPWIVFWVAAAIHSFWGSLISLAVCTWVPLLFRNHRKTVYDLLSGSLVAMCAIALLAGAESVYVVPVSYLLFGIMWSASCFAKIPLTAHYSMNDYNGEAALQNPIFMKTNRILTAAWGVLYLLTPIWTYAIMKTDFGSYVGAINSVLPILMGIFTGWFQKWYPVRVAKG